MKPSAKLLVGVLVAVELTVSAAMFYWLVRVLLASSPAEALDELVHLFVWRLLHPYTFAFVAVLLLVRWRLRRRRARAEIAPCGGRAGSE